VICSRCMGGLEQALAETPAAVDELHLTLSRQTAKVGGDFVRGDSEKPLPYSTLASDALGNLRAVIVSWVKLVIEERCEEQWPVDDVTRMSRWLLQRERFEWLRHHDAVLEALAEIGSAVDRARHAVDRRPDRWFAGPCGGETVNGPCPEDLYASPTSTAVECRECHATYLMQERRDWLREAAHDFLGSAAEISALCRHMLGDAVSAAMIRGYAYRGLIDVHPDVKDPRGRMVPQYKVGEVLAAATAAGSTPAGRRDARKAAREAEELSEASGTTDTRGVA
jgi:hypothetical protein